MASARVSARPRVGADAGRVATWKSVSGAPGQPPRGPQERVRVIEALESDERLGLEFGPWVHAGSSSDPRGEAIRIGVNTHARSAISALRCDAPGTAATRSKRSVRRRSRRPLRRSRRRRSGAQRAAHHRRAAAPDPDRQAPTASERRVAQLASEGLANRRIAQALFVSQAAVLTHLRHSFQKLDISAREQLAGALDS
jgi:DNA-binding NarL/FixJ family response regulator